MLCVFVCGDVCTHSRMGDPKAAQLWNRKTLKAKLIRTFANIMKLLGGGEKDACKHNGPFLNTRNPAGMQKQHTFYCDNRTVTTDTSSYNMRSGWRFQFKGTSSGRDRST